MMTLGSFHSINIPSEWGPGGDNPLIKNKGCFHSINIPSEWGLDILTNLNDQYPCFHSINIPSEWGQMQSLSINHLKSKVSIQLISPASGDGGFWRRQWWRRNVSIQLISPASGDFMSTSKDYTISQSFHSINIPSEWGRIMDYFKTGRKDVSIQLISPASGDSLKIWFSRPGN